MRKEIRKLIKERLEGFEDFDLLNFNNLGIDITSDLDIDKKERRQADVYSYAIVVLSKDGEVRKGMLHFPNPVAMKEYMAIWKQPALVDDYMLDITDHVSTNPDSAAHYLFHHFPGAEVIKIHDFTDTIFVNLDGSIGEEWKTLCNHVNHFPERETEPFKNAWQLFSTNTNIGPSGYYKLAKDGKVLYSKV